ncbi:MAG: hypothetical protein ACRESZ_06455 [Methylococcales bacterium]
MERRVTTCSLFLVLFHDEPPLPMRAAVVESIRNKPEFSRFSLLLYVCEPYQSIEKSVSIRLALATIAILGQAPSK